MSRSTRFVYYQPNNKDLKDNYGDCTIRALSKVLDCTWLEAFDKAIPYCRKYQCASIFSLPLKYEKEIFDELGFDYHGISNAKGTTRPTVNEFVHEHSVGTYILNVANHEVACVDGKYYDTWDCGWCKLYGYFEKRRYPYQEKRIQDCAKHIIEYKTQLKNLNKSIKAQRQKNSDEKCPEMRRLKNQRVKLYKKIHEEYDDLWRYEQKLDLPTRDKIYSELVAQEIY